MLRTAEATTNPESMTFYRQRFAIWKDFAPAVSSIFNAAQERATNLLKPTFKRWDSSTYVREGELPLVDLLTFLDEYVALFAIKEYPYSPYGIPDGRTTLISDRCLNHKALLESAGMETKRAELEVWSAQVLEHWMADSDIPIGTKLVTMSPRGKFQEGYPGTKRANYVFVNIFEKVSPDISSTGFKLVQFTSYDVNASLRTLQFELRDQLEGNIYQPLDLPFPPQQSSHFLISQIWQLPPSVELARLRQHIHNPDREKFWPIKLKDLPQLNVEEFAHYRQVVMDFCQTQFTHLCQTQSPEIASTQFNILMECIRRWFLKWVEDNASNYQKNNEIGTLFDVSPEALIQHINEMWQLQLYQNQLDKTELSRLRELTKASQLNPLGALNRVSSMAHCIAGTPSSVLAQNLNLVKINQLNVSRLAALTPETRQLLKEQLSTLTKLYVTNRETGEIEIHFNIGSKARNFFAQKSKHDLIIY